MQESSPFHIALLSRAKICGLSRYANLEIRITRCLLPSVVKDRRSVQRFPIGTSPLPAEREIGFGTEVASNKKNPATSAGHVRPFPVAALTLAASGTDMLDSRFVQTRCL